MAEETNHIEAAITALEGWLERISTAIDTLRHLLSQGGALPAGLPTAPNSGRAGATEIPHDTFFQMTVPDAAERYLGLVKKTSPNADLADSLLKGGLKSSSQNFAEMVRSVLARDSRFVKVNTEWGLSSWYPGMGKGKKAKVAGKKPSEVPKSSKKPAKRQPAKEPAKPLQVGAETLIGRVLKILNAAPAQTFSASEIAERVGAAKPSVAAALSVLLKHHKIVRPQTGRYQSKPA